MILLYHKVHPELKSEWWVSVDTFYRHMLDLRRHEVVLLDDYDPANPKHAVITFDGVYRNVLEHAVPQMEAFGYPFELFVTGDYIGGDNSFDAPEPLAPFASMGELREMVARGGRIQWHTRSHRRADESLSLEEIAHELDVPAEVRALDEAGCRWFAYPHGDFSEAAVALVRERFDGALSCIQGDARDGYRWNRLTIKEDTPVVGRKVSVIIPTYNYARFLPEAIDSALRQTRAPDEILISDDASTDHSFEIAEHYQELFPDLIRLNRNERNLGIVEHFNKAVSLTSGDYITFLGADNRFRSDYLERTCLALDLDPEAAVAYSDFCLFGDRARIVYSEFCKRFAGTVRADSLYIVHFPNFGDEVVQMLRDGINCMHGSSMYRRDAWQQVGGYHQRSNQPEDFSLFRKMVEAGWKAVRVAEPILEYRQHSPDQDNIKFKSHLELKYFRRKVSKLQDRLARREAELETLRAKLANSESKLTRTRAELQSLKGKFSWHFSKPVRLLEKWFPRR